MPTRKQRRRREKDFRHDVRVYEVDDEGNEIPIAELRAQEERAAKPKPKNASKGRRSARVKREVQPPSWERAFKRGGTMGAVMVLAFLFLLKTGPIAERIAIGVFYAVAFVPLTYWLDRVKYRSDLKRSGRTAPAAKKR